jgi:hypothetical protein
MYFRTFERLIIVKVVFFVARREIEGDLTDAALPINIFH